MKLNLRLLKAARPSQSLIMFSVCIGLVGGILSILQARQVSQAINQVFLVGKTLAAISYLLVTILIIIVLRLGFSWAGEVIASTAARRIKQDLRHKLFTHLLDLGPAYLRSEAGEIHARTGELVTLANEGMDALELYFSQYLPQVVLAALVPLSILIFVFPTDTLSGVIFLITAPLLPLFMYLIGSVAQALTRKQWQGLSRMSAYFLDVLQGLTTLKILGRSREQVDVIQKVSDRYRQSTMSVLRVTFFSALVLELIATLSTAVVAVEIGLRLLYGRLAFEQAFFLLLLAPEFYQPLRLLGTRFHAGMAGVEAARRIFAILDLPAATKPVAGVIHSSSYSPHRSPPAISVRNVSYTYSNGRTALNGISLDLPRGKMTALVGESGAGKSTLTWLILRFLQLQHGQVTVDEKSIAEIPYPVWLESLAYVPQNPYLFNDTILANIRLAKPDADDQAVQRAARLAHADEFIASLPFGYQTQIGEQGLRLSAGQAQRIALARAFLKDAPFLILDEATSHLDPETDALVRESLERLAIGRTVLVIAHHKNTLAMADQVVTLWHGEVENVVIHDRVLPAQQETLSSTIDTIQDHLPRENLPTPGEMPNPEVTRRSNQPVMARLLKLLSPFAGRILLSTLLGFATVASGVGLMATAAYIISAAAMHPSIADLQVAIVGVRFFGLSRGIFRYLERLVSHDTTFRLLARWRVWFYQALEPLAPARLMGYRSGDLLNRVISDIGTLENFYVRSIAPPLVALSVGVVVLLFMGSLGGRLAWGLLFFMILTGVGLPLLALVSARRFGPKIIRERARQSALIVDAIQGMADILTCGQAQAYADRLIATGKRLNQLQARMFVTSALQTALGGLLANLAMLAVLVLATPLVTSGKLDGVLLGVVALVSLTCFEALQPIPLVAQNMESNRAAASRLYELVDASPSVIDPPEPCSLSAGSNLDVRQLLFQYPGDVDKAAPPALPPFSLHDISFSLPNGKHIALVGPSGAGKTTLVNLLLRFWEYQHGSILLDHQELHQYNQHDIRKHIAVISQNTYLFSATIKENLLIARPEASEAEIIRAASQAQLHDFILSLPDGYDTWIGEHGMRLSVGERQRLAIARALLRDARLLILDEPTANLDPYTELAVLDSIRLASQGRSTLTITQSMAGLEVMDEILVLQNGRIIERGSHTTLISSEGLYKRMWDLYHQVL